MGAGLGVGGRMRKFKFDATIFAVVTVTATNLEQAKKAARETLGKVEPALNDGAAEAYVVDFLFARRRSG